MIRAWKGLVLFPVLLLYGMVFRIQESFFQNVGNELQPLPGYRFLQVTAGYLQQLVAEVSFVKTAVFLGGVKAGVPETTYSTVLAHNYLQITRLYPSFTDPYFYTQSYLAGVSEEATRWANEILANGRTAYPENLIFPFFQAFNNFRYLDEPAKASQIFAEASKLPGAPPMFEHLAVILAAEGGQLEAAMISLQALIRGEEDEYVRFRYQEELAMFQDAYRVQVAVMAYHNEKNRYPEELGELVPHYLEVLPDFGRAFILTYNPPIVGLKRP